MPALGRDNPPPLGNAMNEGRLYVLKVWPEPGRFRAALRAVEDDEVLRFEGVQGLCEHFASLAGGPAGLPELAPLHIDEVDDKP
jgi:hypothetical protein